MDKNQKRLILQFLFIFFIFLGVTIFIQGDFFSQRLLKTIHIQSISEENNFNMRLIFSEKHTEKIDYFSRCEGIEYLASDDPIVNESKYGHLIYDSSLFNYLGLEQIHQDLINGITGYNNQPDTPISVVVFDNLIDFKHENLTRMKIVGTPGNEEIVWLDAVDTVVLLNDEFDVPPANRYEEIDVLDIDNIYDHTEEYFDSKFTLYDYLHHDKYSHGTSIAGIINQIAPGVRIISVAYPPHGNDIDVFYEVVLNFFDWLEDKVDDYNIKVVNISNRWSGGQTFGSLTTNQKNTINAKFLNFLNPSAENNIVFTVSAGNTIEQEGTENIVYPSHLANNWEQDTFYQLLGNEVIIDGKYDYFDNPAIATGFISVGSIYDFEFGDYLRGQRDNDYVYDEDKDSNGDLKLMAPGFLIRTTANTKNEYGILNDPPQAYFIGTSAAAPCVAGLAALMYSVDSSLDSYEVEKLITKNALYDINVELENDELIQKYGYGMINPLATLAEFDSFFIDLDTDEDNLTDIEELYTYHTNPFNNDTDSDTMCDWWETHYGTNPFIDDASADPDNDDLTNLEELDYGTDPLLADTDNDGLDDKEELFSGNDGFITDPNDYDSDDDHLWDGWEVNTQQHVNSSYRFDPLDNDTDDDGITDDLEDPDNDGFTNHEEFVYGTDYSNADTDGDGLPDGYEVHFSDTCPLNEDTDGDHLPDYWEITHNLDPLVVSTNDDPDCDGLTNYQEFLANTDPNSSDTDNDGLLDYEEQTYNTDPLNADSDNDGLLDGVEVNTHSTDPNDADSDNDGLLDGAEINTHSTDPNDSDSDNDGLNDQEEVTTGSDGYITDPNDSDTDNDGMDDLYEAINNFNPLSDDSSYDPDNDDLTNIEEYSYGTNPHLSDTDGDGMPDGWEITYSLNPLSDDATGDADGDELHNVSEYTNGCDPTDSDTDNDGLNDKQEILNNCDPNDTDSDNDGWNDYFEVYTSGTEPDKADTDSDGLTDKNEFNYWKYTRGRTTSQAYAYCKDDDVDNDNLKDGAELTVGTDPLDNDSDNDGLYDGSEEYYYDTDPTDYDSDNDGYSDGEEIAAGSDPNDPNDTPGGGGFGS